MRPLIGVTVGWRFPAPGAPGRSSFDGPCAEAILAAGGAPLFLAPLPQPETIPRLLSAFDGFLLSGGGDVEPSRYGARDHADQFGIDPGRDEFEIALVRAAASSDKPLLAICRGCQVLTVALGGTLWQHLPSDKPGPIQHWRGQGKEAAHHRLRLAAASRLAAALALASPPCPPRDEIDLIVNSSHHQAPRELPPELLPAAWSEDGLIEGVESPEAGFLLGVQWHPERMCDEDPSQLALFRAFVQAAAAEAGRGEKPDPRELASQSANPKQE
jgi:putative glutamine amidotransferase